MGLTFQDKVSVSVKSNRRGRIAGTLFYVLQHRVDRIGYALSIGDA